VLKEESAPELKKDAEALNHTNVNLPLQHAVK